MKTAYDNCQYKRTISPQLSEQDCLKYECNRGWVDVILYALFFCMVCGVAIFAYQYSNKRNAEEEP